MILIANRLYDLRLMLSAIMAPGITFVCELQTPLSYLFIELELLSS